MNKNILLLCLSLTLGSGLSSCFDLNKEPEGTLSTTKPFASTGEMQNYLNMFYESAGLQRWWRRGHSGRRRDE